MRLRKLAATAAGGLALAAVGNAVVARSAGALDPPLSGDERTYRWRGMDVAYTEAGDADAPDLLLVHGLNAAATSHEFEPVFGALAEEFHVVAPDLPGFGRSDRPPIEYDADLYVDFLGAFADDLLDDPACVASSLSGAYAVLAHRNESRFSRLVLICPTATTMPTRRPLVRRFLRSPLVGTAAYNLLVSRPSIRYFDADHGYYDPARIDPDHVEYQWTAGHQPGARFAPASFVAGYLDPDADLAAELGAVDLPVTLVWGREADLTPLSYGRDLAEAADARLVVFDRARLLPHVEHADRFRETLVDELRSADLES